MNKLLQSMLNNAHTSVMLEIAADGAASATSMTRASLLQPSPRMLARDAGDRGLPTPESGGTKV